MDSDNQNTVSAAARNQIVRVVTIEGAAAIRPNPTNSNNATDTDVVSPETVPELPPAVGFYRTYALRPGVMTEADLLRMSGLDPSQPPHLHDH